MNCNAEKVEMIE